MATARAIVVLLLGFLLRIVLVDYAPFLQRRIEIATPLSSFPTLQEGIFLHSHSNAAYDGSLNCHTPLELFLFRPLLHASPTLIALIFSILDVVVLALLYLSIQEALSIGKSWKKGQGKGRQVIDTLLNIDNDSKVLFAVCAVYWLSPMTILSTAGRSTTVLRHIFTLLSLFLCMNGHRILGVFALAVSAHLFFYNVTLLFPLTLFLSQANHTSSLREFVISSSTFFIASGGLLFASYVAMGHDWQFFYRSSLFQVLALELRPNTGFLWYMSSEMFSNFITFFTVCLQYHVLLYAFPLTIRLWNEPTFLFWTLFSINATFCAYPSLAEQSVPIALAFLFPSVFKMIDQTYLMLCALLVACVLGPSFWTMWMSQVSFRRVSFSICIAFLLE